MTTQAKPPTEGGHKQAASTCRRSSGEALPAGPRTPAIINMLRYAVNPYAAIKERLRNGDCYTVRMLGQPPIVNFTDPASIKDIFAAVADTVHSGEATSEMLGPIIGWMQQSIRTESGVSSCQIRSPAAETSSSRQNSVRFATCWKLIGSYISRRRRSLLRAGRRTG